jgi:hypothetical protein
MLTFGYENPDPNAYGTVPIYQKVLDPEYMTKVPIFEFFSCTEPGTCILCDF